MFAATVHVPYMNSSRKWEKTREKKKKKKKRKTQQTGNAGNAGNANPNTHSVSEGKRQNENELVGSFKWTCLSRCPSQWA